MLEIYFFNVGHGDSIAIKFPNDTWGLVDCCYNGYFGEPNVLTFLKKLDVNKLEFICVTHPHEDHYIGIDTIIDYFKKNIKQYFVYGLTGNDKEKKDNNSLGKSIKLFATYHNFSKSCVSERLKKLNFIKRNDSFNIADVEITCLNPTSNILDNLRISECLASHKDYNNASVVLLLKYKSTKILLNADSTILNWNEILKNNQDYQSHISKISHHGSIENNSKNILNATNKNNSITIISSDGNVKYKSIPSEKVIGYLKNNLKSSVFSTYDLNNCIEKELSNFYIDDILEDTASDIISDDTSIKVKLYDGFIKLNIDNNGQITKQIFYTLQEYFNYLKDNVNCK